MKPLLLFLTVLAYTSCSIKVQSHYSTKIGKITANGPVITLNQTVLFDDWEDWLNEHTTINVTFDTATIFTENDKYWITGINQSGSIKSTVPLVVDSGNIYEIQTSPGVSHSITCSGCTQGCNPREDEIKGWYCKDPCTSCVKSETVVSGGSGIWQ